MENSLKFIRDRKYRVISNQIDTYKKKLRNVEEIHRNLLHDFAAREEDPHYGLVENEGVYNSVLGFSHGGPSTLALRLQPNQPNLHTGVGLDHHMTYSLLE
ncbi:hypothetical protein F0562_027171 [Nyssa sinensis]|uniref:K-box domain-containing protein n=1 Tax=Nyssa sinensis TaxID=561372 RepID=A0A5J5B2T9_9ASTE|nr:hypothetical protein F0562_027171 [Nyssa sinensis]